MTIEWRKFNYKCRVCGCELSIECDIQDKLKRCDMLCFSCVPKNFDFLETKNEHSRNSKRRQT